MVTGALRGFTVGITADRRKEEQGELLRRLGARVVLGPSVRTLPLAHDDGMSAATEALIASRPDIVIANTGLGFRGWMGAAESMGLGGDLVEALRPAEVIARGPKAAGAVIAAGLQVSWSAPTEQGRDLIAHLLERPLVGVRIAVQRDGAPEPFMARALADAGADVIDVPVYAWTTPDDPAPALRLIEAAVAQRLDAVTFTSSPAVWNLVDLAAAAGLGAALIDAFATTVTAACVGPVCARTAEEHGLVRIVQPRRGRLGAMVAALGQRLGGDRRDFNMGGLPACLQGALLVGPSGEVLLTDRERALMEQLVERPGAVVSKQRLASQAWIGQRADVHTVEVTIGRLRRRLTEVGASLETVPRRGYRLVP